MMNIDSNNPLVSIALCTYNGARFLKEQLDSLVNQTYSNLEIVIVDDCSTDNTVAISKEYAARDERISVIVNQSNLGFNKNFEKCINNCNGDYIAISDQDDIWVLHKIETMVSEWKEGTLLMHHPVASFNGDTLPSLEVTKKQDFSKRKGIKCILSNTGVQGCTILFKKELKQYIFPFLNIGYYDVWLALCSYTNGNIQYVYKNLIYHRKHDGSAFFSIQKSRSIKEIAQKKVDILYELQDRNIITDEVGKVFLEKQIEIFTSLLDCKFSYKAFFWMMRNRHNTLWLKEYKSFPFFSQLLESLKNSKGALAKL